MIGLQVVGSGSCVVPTLPFMSSNLKLFMIYAEGVPSGEYRASNLKVSGRVIEAFAGVQSGVVRRAWCWSWENFSRI